MAYGAQHAKPLTRDVTEIRIGLARQIDGKPLAGHRAPVLESRETDVDRSYPGATAQRFRHIRSVELLFFDEDEEMLALAFGHVQIRRTWG